MSRILPLQTNTFGQAPQALIGKKKKQEIMFTSLPTGEKLEKAENLIVGDLRTTVTTGNKKFKKFLLWLNGRDGEIQNQEINALFTTTLAPLFIAWNPFSKQDKKTKEYTALRQPISATIAVTGGLGMTLGLNYILATMCSEGYMPSIDLRMKPHKDYLKSQFNKEYKSLKTNTEKQDFINKYKPDAKDLGEKESLDPDKITKKTLKKVKNNYFESIQNEKTLLFANLFSEDPKNLKFNKETKAISVVSEDENGKQIIKELGRNIPHIETESDFTKYVESHNLYKVDLKDYMKSNYQFDFFKDGTLKPHSINTELSKVKAMDFLRGFGLVKEGGLNEEELIRVLLTNRQPKAAKRISKIFKDRNEEELQELFAELGKQEARSGQLFTGGDGLKIEKITLKQMFDMLKITNDPNEKADELLQKFVGKNEDFNQTLQKFMDLKTNKSVDYFIQLFKKHGVKGFEEDTVEVEIKNGVKKMLPKFKDCGLRMTKQIAKQLSGDFKNNSKYIGIFTNLFTTAITCTLLNWVYPRVVALCFPSLVKDDSAPKATEKQMKGGN